MEVAIIKRDSQSAKPGNIDFITEHIFKDTMLRANYYTEFVGSGDG